MLQTERHPVKVTIKSRQIILQTKHKQTLYCLAIWVVCALPLYYVKKVRIDTIFILVTGLHYFSWTKTIRNKLLFSAINVDCKSAMNKDSKRCFKETNTSGLAFNMK